MALLAATCQEALDKAVSVVLEQINIHQINPVLSGDWLNDPDYEDGTSVNPTCNFDTTRIFCALSYLQQASEYASMLIRNPKDCACLSDIHFICHR